MLKEIEEPIIEIRCDSVYEFVTNFNLKTQFKKEYGCSLEEWDFNITDQEVIEKFLEGKEGLWRCVFVDDNNDGHFLIQEYDNKVPNITQAIASVGNMIAWIGNNPEGKAKNLLGTLTKLLITLKQEK